MRRIVLGGWHMSSAFRGPIHAGFALLALATILISSCGHRAARVDMREPVTVSSAPVSAPSAPGPPVVVPPALDPVTAINSQPAAPSPVGLPHIDWYVVQAGAFTEQDRAEALRAALEELFADAR